MNKKEWKIEVIVKSVPHLELVPENLMEAFVTGLIENLEECQKNELHKGSRQNLNKFELD